MAGVDRLFLELLFVTLILISIMFVNNIFLYKQKVTDSISLMLISGILMSVFEILWAVIDEHPKLRVLAYICVCCYCMACVGFGVFINRFLMERLGLRFGKKRDRNRLCCARGIDLSPHRHHALDEAAVLGR